MDSMKDRICLITGATSGIGRATAFKLAEMGAEIILLGRNDTKGEDTARRIKRKTGNNRVVFYRADLSLLSEVRACAELIRSRYQRIDVLVNNAGARFEKFKLTSEGNELTFATNHLGHFLLTRKLLPLLNNAPGARIINVSSGNHSGGKEFNVEDSVDPASYGGRQAYANAKLANILFTYSLAERLKPYGVTVNSVDPGGVATNFSRNNGFFAWARHISYYLLHRSLITPAQGAETIIYLASSPDVSRVTGKHFYKMHERASSDLSYDDSCRNRLWDLSCKLCGIPVSSGVSF
jgi:NAD(P)-dependent dehydrogenase (short-subunit alcohol dehydrogenase family)